MQYKTAQTRVRRFHKEEAPLPSADAGRFRQFRRLRLALLTAGIGSLFLLLLKNPAVTASAALDGLLLAVKTVLPSTFPYMILSQLLLSCGAGGRYRQGTRSHDKAAFLSAAGLRRRDPHGRRFRLSRRRKLRGIPLSVRQMQKRGSGTDALLLQFLRSAFHSGRCRRFFEPFRRRTCHFSRADGGHVFSRDPSGDRSETPLPKKRRFRRRHG